MELMAAQLRNHNSPKLAPGWLEFIRYCQELGHGEIERLIIQDGIPVLAELTRKKIKFARERQ
jgi:hypothetical protein